MKNKSQDEAAIAALRHRLLVTLRFFEGAQDFPTATQICNLVKDAAARHDLRTLRLIGREVDAMTIGLAPNERDGLEAVLRENIGIDVVAERAELKRKADAAIARGAVASEKERRRLEDYAEMLEASGGDPAEIAAVRRLVASS